MTIKWIGLDLDWTLYPPIAAFEGPLLKEFYAVGKEWDLTTGRVDEERRKRSDLFNDIAKRALDRAPHHRLKQVARRAISETVRRLADDYDVYIITNSQKKHVQRTMDTLNLDKKYFELVIADGAVYHIKDYWTQMGSTGHKPAASPFRWAVKYSRVSPANHVYIGDSDTNDIAPSRAIGMKAIKIGERSKYKDEKVKYARSVVEVPPIIRKL